MQAMEQALVASGLPATIVEEVQWRLQAQQQLPGKIFGLLLPLGVWLPQLPRALPSMRLGQDPARPSPGGLAPQRKWMKHQQCLGEALLVLVTADQGQEPGQPQPVGMDLGGR